VNKSKNYPEPYSELLNELTKFGITTPKGLRKFIRTKRKFILSEDKRLVKNCPPILKELVDEARGVFFTHVGLVRIAMNTKLVDQCLANTY
jgi:hypothetical protein